MFSPIFLADTKIVFGYNFLARLNGYDRYRPSTGKFLFPIDFFNAFCVINSPDIFHQKDILSIQLLYFLILFPFLEMEYILNTAWDIFESNALISIFPQIYRLKT